MKRLRKIYLEISNVCNLHCTFCPGTRREKRFMTADEFATLLPKLRPWTDYLYFHLMGEPLCHPELAEFLRLAGDAGFKVILTTNGTLLEEKREILLNAPALHKVNISLHAFEANDLSVPFETYLSRCFSFGQAAERKFLVVYRLWNGGGAEQRNPEFSAPWNGRSPLHGTCSPGVRRSPNVSIWNTATNSTGLTSPPPTAGNAPFATGCGIRSAYCATAPLSPAVLTMRATLLWGICLKPRWRKSGKRPALRRFIRALPRKKRQRNSAASVGMPDGFCKL